MVLFEQMCDLYMSSEHLVLLGSVYSYFPQHLSLQAHLIMTLPLIILATVTFVILTTVMVIPLFSKSKWDPKGKVFQLKHIIL
jgi:hypothetical protein